jgi:hypothetical protein
MGQEREASLVLGGAKPPLLCDHSKFASRLFSSNLAKSSVTAAMSPVVACASVRLN